jgi:hypothetical protein
MHDLLIGGVNKYLVTLVAVAVLAMVGLWLGSREPVSHVARDFEECVELAQADAPSNDERSSMMRACGAQFAGRRKPSGGYAYYDFMQDRSFDIAGPNPTADERKRIDDEYMVFLDAQRREAISAEMAKRRNEQLQADIERARQPVGPPTVLTPTVLTPKIASSSVVGKKPADRAKHCEPGTLSCGWAKFSAVVKNAFASSPKSKSESK